jgi:hypothetical protein
MAIRTSLAQVYGIENALQRGLLISFGSEGAPT